MITAYEGKVLWSPIDANMHLRHCAYADFAAQARIDAFSKAGLTLELYDKYKIGPILFREELIYHREVRINDTLKITTELTHFSHEKFRYSMKNELFRSDGIKSATVNIDGAWIDMEKRKLTHLPYEILEIILTMINPVIK